MEQKALWVLTSIPPSAPGVSLQLCKGPTGLGRSTQLTASPYASWRGQHVPNPIPQHQAHSPVLRGAWMGPPVQMKDGTKPAVSIWGVCCYQASGGVILTLPPGFPCLLHVLQTAMPIAN